MSNPELEKEYSPSEWSKRFSSRADVINFHIGFIEQTSAEARQSIPNRLNVNYGDSDIEVYDIYGTQLPKDSPIFVYIHGGYWQMLTKQDSAYCVQPLVAAGIRVVIVDYELCPKITLASLVRQIQKAGHHLLEFAASSGSRISFGGHSAGAHLAISMLSADFLEQAGDNARFLNGLFLISGVYDLIDLRYTDEVNKDNLLALSDDIVRVLSPIYQNFEHLKALEIEVFLHVAEHDSPTFIRQSEVMSKRLKTQTNLKVEYRLIGAVDHFNIVENLSQADFEITNSIIRNLKKFH